MTSWGCCDGGRQHAVARMEGPPFSRFGRPHRVAVGGGHDGVCESLVQSSRHSACTHSRRSIKGFRFPEWRGRDRCVGLPGCRRRLANARTGACTTDRTSVYRIECACLGSSGPVRSLRLQRRTAIQKIMRPWRHDQLRGTRRFCRHSVQHAEPLQTGGSHAHATVSQTTSKRK